MNASCYTRRMLQTLNTIDKTKPSAETTTDQVQSIMTRIARKRKICEVDSSANVGEPVAKRSRIEYTVEKHHGRPETSNMDFSVDSDLNVSRETEIEYKATSNFGKKKHSFRKLLTVELFVDALSTMKFNPDSAESWRTLTKCLFKRVMSKKNFRNKMRLVRGFWAKHSLEITNLLPSNETLATECSKSPVIESTTKMPAKHDESVIKRPTRTEPTEEMKHDREETSNMDSILDSIGPNISVSTKKPTECKKTSNAGKRKYRFRKVFTIELFVDALSTMEFNPDSAESWRALTKCLFKRVMSKKNFRNKMRLVRGFWAKHSSEIRMLLDSREPTPRDCSNSPEVESNCLKISKVLSLNEPTPTECSKSPETEPNAKMPANDVEHVAMRPRLESTDEQETSKVDKGLNQIDSNLSVSSEKSTEHKETPNLVKTKPPFKIVFTVELFVDALSTMQFDPRCADSWKALTTCFFKRVMSKKHLKNKVRMVKRFWEKNFSEIAKLLPSNQLPQNERPRSPEIESISLEKMMLLSSNEPMETECLITPEARSPTNVDEPATKKPLRISTLDAKHLGLDRCNIENNLDPIDSNLSASMKTEAKRRKAPNRRKKKSSSRNVLTVQLFVEALSSMQFEPERVDNWKALTKYFFKRATSKQLFRNKIRLVKAFWEKHFSEITKLLPSNESTPNACSRRTASECELTDIASGPSTCESNIAAKSPENGYEVTDVSSRQILIIVFQ